MPIQQWQDIVVQQLRTAQRKLGIIPAGFLPVGGLAGQVLAKNSPVNYDVIWAPILGTLVLAGRGLVIVGNTLHFAQSAAYTPGAVAFATTAAAMGFDPATFFWDNSTKRLGLNIAAPANTLHVVGTTFLNGVVGVLIAPDAATALNLEAGTTGRSQLRFNPGVAPTTPVEGDVWYHQSEGTLDLFLNGIERHFAGSIFDQTADQTVANTLTETTLFGAGNGTLTLPANFFKAGGTLFSEIRGHVETTGNPTLRIRSYLGATVLMDTTALALGALTGQEYFRISLKMTCRTAGAPGSIAVAMAMEYHRGVGSAPMDMLESIPAAVAVTTTGALTLNITAQWGTANPANIITSVIGFVGVQQ